MRYWSRCENLDGIDVFVEEIFVVFKPHFDKNG
jgi:hypothetical protein